MNTQKGLSVKDLVTTGIFTALMLVFTMLGGMFFAPNESDEILCVKFGEDAKIISIDWES